MGNELVLFEDAKPSATGLQIADGLSFERWAQIGEKLNFVEGAVHWWIGDWVNYGEGHWGEMYSQALDATQYEYGTLRNDAYVAGRIELSRRRDNLPFSHHQEVASLEPDEQDELLDLAEENSWKRMELRTEIRKRKHANLLTPPQFTGKYSVIYADPPWEYDHPISDSRRIENQYPTMPAEEICALRVADICEDKSILFMWATTPMLKKAFAVMDAWGFDYRTCMVWVKPSIGPGYWVRQRHELLLIGIKGDIPTPADNGKPDSVLEAPRQEHSKKPEAVYDIIEKMYPGYSRIELFARNKRDGWEAWGNQV